MASLENRIIEPLAEVNPLLTELHDCIVVPSTLSFSFFIPDACLCSLGASISFPIRNGFRGVVLFATFSVASPFSLFLDSLASPTLLERRGFAGRVSCGRDRVLVAFPWIVFFSVAFIDDRRAASFFPTHNTHPLVSPNARRVKRVINGVVVFNVCVVMSVASSNVGSFSDVTRLSLISFPFVSPSSSCCRTPFGSRRATNDFITYA